MMKKMKTQNLMPINCWTSVNTTTSAKMPQVIRHHSQLQQNRHHSQLQGNKHHYQQTRGHLQVRHQLCQQKTSSQLWMEQMRRGNSMTMRMNGVRMIFLTLRSLITKIPTSTKWVTSSCNATSKIWKKNFLKMFWNQGTRVFSTTNASTTPATIRTKSLEKTAGMKARTTTISMMTSHDLITITIFSLKLIN